MLKVEVLAKTKEFDSMGINIAKDMITLGYKIDCVRTSSVYIFENDIDRKFLEDILKDEITDDIYYDVEPALEETISIDIFAKSGVMDPVSETLSSYLKRSGFNSGIIRTGRRFYFYGTSKLNENEIIGYIRNRYFNPLIEKHGKLHLLAGKSENQFKINEISLNCDLIELSRKMTLSLNIEEMKRIKDYFYIKKKRKPTDIELETIAQTWSEHCVHKTMKSPYIYKGKKIKNLFKETIVRATEEINHEDAVSVFSDNAGIFKFDEFNNVCFKVETHNHPSALEPYGGAGTGTGGVIRDIIGTGLSAKPIANTDVFCIGDFNYKIEGVIEPEEILKGVVLGVRDYGNRMGIPTVNGAVCFHPNYIGNPLVFCGSIGIMNTRNSFKKVYDKDMIVLIGGKTGKDGIHGATFSSVSLTDDSQDLSSGAVQIGNPIEEKKMLDAILEADGLFTAITDCGAGGLSSAVGEMGENTGAIVYLDRVPIKYDGLTYDEIWISESQERMVLSVNERNYEELKRIVEKHNTNIAHIGYFTGKDLKIIFKDKVVLDIDMSFLHKGVPLPLKKSKPYPNARESVYHIKAEIVDAAFRVLSHPDVKSKEWIIRQYDHEVQSQTLIKPLGGDTQSGANDSAVISPIDKSERCLVVGCGINPRYGELNPMKMTYSVIDEAVRNVLCQGGDIKHAFMLDNFSWGNTNKETTLGGLIESCLACKDYSIKLKIPFISGKDSLNNFFMMKEKEIEIPPTLLISVISVTEKSRIRQSYFNSEESFVYIFGEKTKNELLGSVLFDIYKIRKGRMPFVNQNESLKTHIMLSNINKTDIVTSCHDISDGGLFTAIFEMSLGNHIGCDIRIKTDITPIEFLFSETQSRYLIQVNKDKQNDFEKICGSKAILIGETNKSDKLTFRLNRATFKFRIKELEKVYR
ncbi:MAG: phosphoribosylformylglycinamidine synthase subunit PurL [bacterium (Candidatus Stahlbacteria) CG23_combo_of_CG06-09_8_20_14_all_34_7]|nr:MAG: phosphoribosylformylglycinamidine synthase subunit PurL [bacterium (Candidatus Stahlbacteria) CG23_combo_of_CG06-09_8_20_14_all_34_7]